MSLKREGKVLPLIKAHPYSISAMICILFWLVTGGTVRFLNNAGISTMAMMVTYIALVVVIIAAGIVLGIRKRLDTSALILLIAAAGILARMWFAMYSMANDPYQHDIGNFDRNPVNAVHDNYIFYLYDNCRLPDFDFRGYGQFYHPPLHHIISAVAMKINSFVFPGRAGNYEFLMCISLFYSLVTMILLYKILRFFKIEGTALVASFMLVAFYPFLIISAGQINNDPLANMFFIAAFYNALRWYERPGYKRIILTAVCIGLAMMSKLSTGLIAVPVGFIFLAGLLRSRFRDKHIWLQFLSFAGIAFPLGLWFPVRNLIRWGIPPTYVFDLGIIPSQDLSGYSLTERLFGTSEASMSIPYVIFDENYKEFNIFTVLFKSSLFDDFDHHDKFGITLIATILLFLGLILVIMFIVGLIKALIRAFRKHDTCLFAVLIMLVTEFASIIVFAFKYPLTCSVNFRYVFPTVICFLLFTALCFPKSGNEYRRLLQKIAMGVIVLFSVTSIAFYACEWTAMPFF